MFKLLSFDLGVRLIPQDPVGGFVLADQLAEPVYADVKIQRRLLYGKDVFFTNRDLNFHKFTSKLEKPKGKAPAA